MATKVKRIFDEVESRLEDTGYPVVPAGKADSQTDSFPWVTYYPHPDSARGIQTIEEDVRTPPSHQGGREDLYLVIDIQIEPSDVDDPLGELEGIYENVRQEIFRDEDPYLRDQNGDELARDYIIQTERHHFVPSSGDSVAKMQVTIKIPFFEDN